MGLWRKVGGQPCTDMIDVGQTRAPVSCEPETHLSQDAAAVVAMGLCRNPAQRWPAARAALIEQPKA